MEEMIQLLERNKDNLLTNSQTLNYSDDIYGLLLKTGRYLNAQFIIYQMIISDF